MRGTVRKISLPRRLHRRPHACLDPACPLSRCGEPSNIRQLIEARANAAQPPGWAAIFVKAFCLVAKDEPVLRTLYVKWPWPHFYELPRSVAMVAIARVEDGEDCVLPQKVAGGGRVAADRGRCADPARQGRADRCRSRRSARSLQATRLPLPLRRLIWLIGLNFGRQRANYFGSFGVTSVAAYGAGELHALSPGPYILSYGVVGPDHSIDVVIRWDHRVTDAALIAKVLTRLEQVLNTEIAAELRGQQAAEPSQNRSGRCDLRPVRQEYDRFCVPKTAV